jgi:hypothetical protein
MSPKQHAYGEGDSSTNPHGTNLPMPPAFGNLGLRNGGAESPSSAIFSRSGPSAGALAGLPREANAEETLQSHAQVANGDQDAAIDPSLEGLPPVPSHWAAPTSPTKDAARILDFNHDAKLANSEIVVDPTLMDVGAPGGEAEHDAMSPSTTLMTAIAAARAEDTAEGYANGERLALSLGAAFEQQEGAAQKTMGNGFDGVNGDLGVDDETRTHVDSQGADGEKPEIDLVAW